MTDDVMKFFFLWTILSVDDTQKFSYQSDVAFYICNYDVITRAPMTSKKIILIPHEEYLPCAKVQFFFLGAVSEIQRSKFFMFFQYGCCTTSPMTS